MTASRPGDTATTGTPHHPVAVRPPPRLTDPAPHGPDPWSRPRRITAAAGGLPLVGSLAARPVPRAGTDAR